MITRVFYSIVAFLFAVPSICSASTEYNDLKASSSVVMDFSVAVTKEVDGTQSDKKILAIFLDHDYSNTLECDFKISLRREDDGVTTVTYRGVPVYPIKISGRDYITAIPESISPGIAQFKLNQVRRFPQGAVCRGRDMSKPLPAYYCTTLNRDHEKTCDWVRSGAAGSGNPQYPLMWGDNYMGPCACDQEY